MIRESFIESINKFLAERNQKPEAAPRIRFKFDRRTRRLLREGHWGAHPGDRMRRRIEKAAAARHARNKQARRARRINRLRQRPHSRKRS